jgi:hypothetical protein
MDCLSEQQNQQEIERVDQLSTLDISASLVQLEADAGSECYICNSREVSDTRKLKCGHALCLECIQSQIEHLPHPGQQFSTRNAKCGICSDWIEYENAAAEFAAVRQRNDALLERLKGDADPDPELAGLLADGSLLSKWQFMICV